MERKVKGPAIGLIVTAGLGIPYCIDGIVGALVGTSLMQELTKALLEMIGMSFEAPEMASWQVTLALASNVIFICLYGFVIWAALRMKRLEGWGTSLAACIIAMVPCSCCCTIGLPFGIWGIVMLVNEDVKRAFAGETPP